MLELNISFIFHLFFIIIGCRVITYFLNKLYDNTVDFKIREKEYLNEFNNKKRILHEKSLSLENNFNNNIKDINGIIKQIANEKSTMIDKSKSFQMNAYPILSEKTKMTIDNYFLNLVRKIN